MVELIFYLILLVVIFAVYYLFAVSSKRRLNKFSKNTYVGYLIGVYKLDKERINMKEMALTIAMINSFVISTTIFIVLFIENMVVMFISGFATLVALQLLMYHIAGKIFQKRFRREK